MHPVMSFVPAIYIYICVPALTHGQWSSRQDMVSMCAPLWNNFLNLMPNLTISWPSYVLQIETHWQWCASHQLIISVPQTQRSIQLSCCSLWCANFNSRALWYSNEQSGTCGGVRGRPTDLWTRWHPTVFMPLGGWSLFWRRWKSLYGTGASEALGWDCATLCNMYYTWDPIAPWVQVWERWTEGSPVLTCSLDIRDMHE